MTAPVKDGDWVCKGLLGFQGTAEGVTDTMLTIRLDPGHSHFRDTIYSRQRETLLVRAYAIQEAERDIAHAQADVRSADKQIRWAQQRKREAQKQLRAARAELRQAQKIPVRSPFAEEVPA